MPLAVRAALLFLAALLCFGIPACGSITSEFIFVPGSTSFPASHASTVVELSDGTLLAAWFGGTAEGNPDVAIWASHRTSQGWSKPAEVVREPGTPCWNPVLFHTRNGRLWLYYKFGPDPSQWTAGRLSSNDEGHTWSRPEHLPAGLIGPVRAKPLILDDGSLVSGSSVESYHSWAAWIERSADNGRSWSKIGPFVPDPEQALLNHDPASIANARYGIIQPSVVQLKGSHLRFYARPTEQIGRICIADSFDSGLTWSRPRLIDLPNPNSGIDAVTLHDGRVVLVFNNTRAGRTPLNLAVSEDGEHFHVFATLESSPGEYSYAALIQDRDGDLDLTYTWNRRSIRYTHIPLAGIPR